jgi:hypothetical protein
MTEHCEPDVSESPHVSEAEVRQAVDELNALRDELYLAGFDVPMPGAVDEEDRIQLVLSAHRAAPRSAPAKVEPVPVPGKTGRTTRRRLFALAGAVVAAAAAGTAGWLVTDQARPRRASAATPQPLAVQRIAGDARRRLEQIAGRVAVTEAASGPVEHLVTDSWNLDSMIDGHTVTSAVVPAREQLWRATDGSAVTIDEYLPPEFPTAQDRADWQDDGSPGADRSPRRTPYPAGTFVAAWDGRPPVEPGPLRSWLRRQDPTDAAVPSAIPELLHERVLTGPEHRALLTVLATEPSLRLLGTTTDRAGRTGLVFTTTSTAGGADYTYRYVISPDTGAVLAHERILTGGAQALRVQRPAVISYNTYISAEFVAAMP